MVTVLAITALLLREPGSETCVGRIEALHEKAAEAVQTAPFACTGTVSFQFDVTARGAGGRSISRQGGSVALTAAESVLGRITANQPGSAVLTVSTLHGPEMQCKLDYIVAPASGICIQPTGDDSRPLPACR